MRLPADPAARRRLPLRAGPLPSRRRDQPDRVEAAPGGLLQARRPLRVFITSPGLAETELEAALRGKGGKRSVPEIGIEMWPAFDAYDLRLTFADGTAWAIDVKDWASPSLLGATDAGLRRRPRRMTGR